jgi:hypothetical protein
MDFLHESDGIPTTTSVELEERVGLRRAVAAQFSEDQPGGKPRFPHQAVSLLPSADALHTYRIRAGWKVGGRRRPLLWGEPHEPVPCEGEPPKRLSPTFLPVEPDPAPSRSYRSIVPKLNVSTSVPGGCWMLQHHVVEWSDVSPHRPVAVRARSRGTRRRRRRRDLGEKVICPLRGVMFCVGPVTFWGRRRRAKSGRTWMNEAPSHGWPKTKEGR